MVKKKKKIRIGLLAFALSALLILGLVFVPWAMKYENLRGLKDYINSTFFQGFWQDYYSAKSLVLIDCSNGDAVISKRPKEQQLPASLAKLFVIEYAATLLQPEDVIPVSTQALALTKPYSSVANITAKEYYAENLYAAMLVPSGNDAAYALADYCGGLLSPQAKEGIERVTVFMDALNGHLLEKGYTDTVLFDPSGYDSEALTTAEDLSAVTSTLLEQPWFRQIVSQGTYTAVLPDGSTQVWQNTNEFLDTSSEYYCENVAGVKTGSLSENYNLLVLYRQFGKEFLICSLGSESDWARYNDMNYLLQTIDGSDYLRH